MPCYDRANIKHTGSRPRCRAWQRCNDYLRDKSVVCTSLDHGALKENGDSILPIELYGYFVKGGVVRMMNHAVNAVFQERKLPNDISLSPPHFNQACYFW